MCGNPLVWPLQVEARNAFLILAILWVPGLQGVKPV